MLFALKDYKGQISAVILKRDYACFKCLNQDFRQRRSFLKSCYFTGSSVAHQIILETGVYLYIICFLLLTHASHTRRKRAELEWDSRPTRVFHTEPDTVIIVRFFKQLVFGRGYSLGKGGTYGVVIRELKGCWIRKLRYHLYKLEQKVMNVLSGIFYYENQSFQGGRQCFL